MRNPYQLLRDLLPNPPLQVGNVISVFDGIATVELPGGGRATARGDAAAGQRVFFRDGAIEGPAPDLPIELIEV